MLLENIIYALVMIINTQKITFWMDLLKYGKGFNLKEKLLYYRVVETSQTAVGNSNVEKRKEILGNIHKRYF